MLRECKLVVEDLLCDTQERNDIRNEDQNNIKKEDEFIAKNFEEISKLKGNILNELSNVRYTEIEREREREGERERERERVSLV